jgi:hypothetical protein
MKASLYILALSLVALVIAMACGGEAPATEPAATSDSPPVGGWTESRDGDNLSISLEAYETGDGEGDGRLTVTCFDSPPLGRYISTNIAWDSRVSVTYNLDVQMKWDSESTVFETWDGSPAGNNVSPTRKELDGKFIDGLLEHDHLEFAVEGEEGLHHAKFRLPGFGAAYGPVKTHCEDHSTSGKDYVE